MAKDTRRPQIFPSSSGDDAATLTFFEIAAWCEADADDGGVQHLGGPRVFQTAFRRVWDRLDYARGTGPLPLLLRGFVRCPVRQAVLVIPMKRLTRFREYFALASDPGQEEDQLQKVWATLEPMVSDIANSLNDSTPSATSWYAKGMVEVCKHNFLRTIRNKKKRGETFEVISGGLFRNSMPQCGALGHSECDPPTLPYAHRSLE